MVKKVEWFYRIDGKGGWEPFKVPYLDTAQDVADAVAEEDWGQGDEPATVQVEVKAPDGAVTRWDCSPEYSVNSVSRHLVYFAHERCACGCVATTHNRNGAGECRICAACGAFRPANAL